jgi:hypothetical protein
MIRRLAMGAAGVALGMTTLAGPVAAQESPATVLPTVVERPVEVKGVQLPRTGGDINGEVFRRRRGLRSDGPAASPPVRRRLVLSTRGS